MKKLFLTMAIILAVIAVLFTYVLYSEGYFDSPQEASRSDMAPFEMKCEAGKCASGKCASKK